METLKLSWSVMSMFAKVPSQLHLKLEVDTGTRSQGKVERIRAN